jgi:hypothetical protein
MDRPLTDLAGERLVRNAPNHIVALDPADQAYIKASLEAIEHAFSIAAVPDVPIGLMPGRTLMRLMVDVRSRLKPRSSEQREAWGRLAGAILVLDTACSFANEHQKAQTRRLEGDPSDLE